MKASVPTIQNGIIEIITAAIPLGTNCWQLDTLHSYERRQQNTGRDVARAGHQ
jgi:hypothetical protein